MIGSTNTLVDKKGGYIEPLISNGFIWQNTGITLPYNFVDGRAVIFRGEVHILGGSVQALHYKWNGNSWEKVSTLPYNLTRGSAIVYNDEIHIIGRYHGGSSSYGYEHYKWDGTTWTEVSELLGRFYDGSLVIHKGEMHALSSNSTVYHQKWDGTSWIKVSNAPYSFNGTVSVSYHDELYIFGSSASGSYGTYSKFNDETSTWSTYTMPFQSYNSSLVVYNDEIHIIGSNVTAYANLHYAFNGTSWRLVSVIPYRFYRGAAILFNDEIFLLGSDYNAASAKYFYKGKLGKRYSMVVPYGTTVRTDVFTPINMATTSGTISADRFVANKLEYCDLEFTIGKDSPVTVVKDRSILYIDTGKNTDGSKTLLALKNMKVNDESIASDGIITVPDGPINIEY